MSSRKQIEKWGAVVLGALCAFLVFRVVSEIWGNRTPVADTEEMVSAAAAPRPARPGTRGPQGATTSADSGSALQVRPLKEFPSNQLPDIGRDPFDFGPPPLTPAQRAAQAARAAAVASAAPATPRIPFQAIGCYENVSFGLEAFLADSDEVYIVHGGDIISHRYKVLRVTASMVEVKDGASGETAQLPIPQVQ
ncbi:MAG: hypothetical protein P8Z30_03190 [Acidobacteriota bacterium]